MKRIRIELKYMEKKNNDVTVNIHSLPIEIFYEGIFKYLTDVEILNFGKTGNRKFEIIAEEYLKCKYDRVSSYSFHTKIRRK